MLLAGCTDKIENIISQFHSVHLADIMSEGTDEVGDDIKLT